MRIAKISRKEAKFILRSNGQGSYNPETILGKAVMFFRENYHQFHDMRTQEERISYLVGINIKKQKPHKNNFLVSHDWGEPQYGGFTHNTGYWSFQVCHRCGLHSGEIKDMNEKTCLDEDAYYDTLGKWWYEEE